ncbi:hypothetical protein AAFF_G00132340 [Aldrovandia affinis]|uniref:Uncharacterized protein n=1 Tax=Aldrovandia affinis TaxID=143900 RepID=A0AAD7RQW8_9TELE|nr:hypothetical protein AAFF_G00132340 [Aldrovandia affinis]
MNRGRVTKPSRLAPPCQVCVAMVKCLPEPIRMIHFADGHATYTQPLNAQEASGLLVSSRLLGLTHNQTLQFPTLSWRGQDQRLQVHLERSNDEV